MSFVTMSTITALVIVIVGFILPLRLSWRSKAIMCVIALLAVSKSYIYHIVGGNTYDPEIPYNLSFVFDIARTTMLFLIGALAFYLPFLSSMRSSCCWYLLLVPATVPPAPTACLKSSHTSSPLSA